VISKDIVDFIKAQKEKRQVIIASHNANLVVCSDSEEVLVSENINNNFKYKTGAIEDLSIRESIIEILEGGRTAIKKRYDKLNLNNPST
jgi:hypothetical protein